MGTIRKYQPFFIAAVLMYVVLWLIYPYYQYYVDPDATAYLTIAKRYAAGDYHRAVNGYWSPWSIWITALFIKAGFASFAAAVVTNAMGALGLLFISQALWTKMDMRRDLQWVLTITLALFLCYAIFKQTFDDIWACFFLLATLRIMLAHRFIESIGMWVAMGLVGTLAYFAKAYSFPFFILNTIICLFFVTKSWQPEGRMLWLRISVVAILVMIAGSLPWIYLLHDKYGEWMTGTAGKLNLSWYLVGHPYWKEGIDVLVPPVYPDSPYYWEDPYLVNGITPQCYSSFRLLGLQLVRAVFNLLKLVQAMSAISVFYAITWVLALGIMLSKKVRDRFGGKSFVVALSFLLFPIGFVLINFEPRYIWYTLPLSMLLGAMVLERMMVFKGNKPLKQLVIALFAASYLVTPVMEMAQMYGEGRTEHEQAAALNGAGLQGSFTTNLTYGSGRLAAVARLAYFSGMQYYNLPHASGTQQILADMDRYHVNYYFHFHNGDTDNFQLKDGQGRPFQEIGTGRFPGLQVFLVNP